MNIIQHNLRGALVGYVLSVGMGFVSILFNSPALSVVLLFNVVFTLSATHATITAIELSYYEILTTKKWYIVAILNMTPAWYFMLGHKIDIERK